MIGKKDGGPAFPTAELDGMTLRDWFAGQALAGILACPVVVKLGREESVTRVAYKIADAVLAEREKPE